MLEIIMNIINSLGIPLLTVLINAIILVVSIAISINLYKNKEITE
jgi:cell division protein FtsX